MKRRAIISLVLSLLLPRPSAAQQAVLTYHYDNTRHGAYNTETALTVGNVNQSQFGKLWSLPVHADMYARPLYVPNVTIKGKVHNVLYVETQHSAVLALDADSPVNPYLWVDGLDTEKLYPYTCIAAYNEAVGIFGTPVIDPDTQTLYTVVASWYQGKPIQQLFALDITTGAIRAKQVVGSGTAFNPRFAIQRASLTRANGNIYVSEAILCDGPPNSGSNIGNGWIFAYDENTLAPAGDFEVTPTSYDGGIWAGGGGALVGSAGNIYVGTGNGGYGPPNYADSVLKLSPNLTLLDSFTPMNQKFREMEDEDVDSGGMVLLPGGYLLSTGKQGTVYLLNQNNLGGYSPTDAGVAQEFNPGREMFTTPVFWNSTIYMAPADGHLSAYSFTNGRINTTPISQSKESFPFPGGALTLTSNGPDNAILWALQIIGKSEVLYAYDAADLKHVLWSSEQNVRRDWVGPQGSEFKSFICANGKCYVPGGNAIQVYGLLNAN